MAQIIDFQRAKALRESNLQAELEKYDTLTCPRCEHPTRPHAIQDDGSVVYSCNHGHRKVTWRIAEDGEMHHGLKGRPYTLGDLR
jgi:hypothetical protein